MTNQPGLPPTPENAHEYAEWAARSLGANQGVSLDFSRPSLENVDRVIDGFRLAGKDAEQLTFMLFSLGCYVGDVLVRNAGATWRKTSDTYYRGIAGSPLMLELSPDAYCNPIDKVFKCMKNGSAEDSLVQFCNAALALRR